MTKFRFFPFRPASAEKFAERCPQFGEFLTWDRGCLWETINSESAYQLMAAETFKGHAAIGGITQLLVQTLTAADDAARDAPEQQRFADRMRQAIGSMVREVMEANRFRKTGRLRAVPPNPIRLFVRAEVFELTPPTMPATEEGFDWDAFAAKTSFSQIQKLSPELGNRRLPSMYCPNRQWYYLSSLDLDVPCADAAQLRLMLREVRGSFKLAMAQADINPLRLHLLKADFVEVFGMLSDLEDVLCEADDPR